jgi:hypothetical protein
LSDDRFFLVPTLDTSSERFADTSVGQPLFLFTDEFMIFCYINADLSFTLVIRRARNGRRFLTVRRSHEVDLYVFCLGRKEVVMSITLLVLERGMGITVSSRTSKGQKSFELIG